ncbi:MAG: restriction endonuclease [bacterium]|nr:restriction endonuclease [bacterium]
MWLTIEALRSLDASGRIAEIAEKVATLAGLPDDQQSNSPRGFLQSDLDSRLAWARTALKHSGLIENSSHGVWSLTENGRTCKEQQAIAAYQTYLDHLKSRRTGSGRVPVPARGQEEVEAEVTHIEEPVDSDRVWQDELLDLLKKMDPAAFERLTQRLLREAGFRNVKVLGRSGDGGIDGVGVYRVSLVSFPTYFQCKRYQGAVPAKEVRDFRGALAGRGDKGLLVTTGTFTSSAREEANRDGATPIDLVDGEELCELLKMYELGVKTRTIEESAVVADFFEEI